MMRGTDAIDVDLASAARRAATSGPADRRSSRPRRRPADRLAFVVGRRRVVRRRDRIAFAGLVDLHRLAVEVRVGEMAGRAAEVDQREVELAWCPRGRACRGRRSA